MELFVAFISFAVASAGLIFMYMILRLIVALRGCVLDKKRAQERNVVDYYR